MVAKTARNQRLTKGIGKRSQPADPKRNDDKRNVVMVRKSPRQGHAKEKRSGSGSGSGSGKQLHIKKRIEFNQSTDLPVSARTLKTAQTSTSHPAYRLQDNMEAVYDSFGEPDVLKLRSIRPNTSKRTGIVVMVEASTISFTDCLIRRNLYDRVFREASLPNSPGVDFVGIVVHVGDLAKKHDGFKVGDRVASFYQFLGGNARFVSLPAEHCVRVPHDVDPCEAACLIRPYLAALQMLFRVGGSEKAIQRGDHVLVTGANGAVGRAVVELSKLNGAIVYASCRRQHKHFILNVVGADVWLDEDPRIWEPLEMDIVIDLVCYTGDFKDVQKALGRDGIKMICAGTAKLQNDEIKHQQILFEEYKNSSPGILSGLCGLNMGNNIYKADAASVLPELCSAVCKAGVDRVKPWSSLLLEYDIFESTEEKPELMVDDLSILFDLLEQDRLKPIIQETISLEEVAQAHALIERGGLQGTIVCRP